MGAILAQVDVYCILLARLYFNQNNDDLSI